MALLYPTLYKERITDITPQELHSRGIVGLLLDVDNTLTTHGSQHLSDEVRQWLQDMQSAGIAMTVVSNARESRVAPFAEQLGLRHISLACKPLPFGFVRGARRLHLKRTQCAVVGDQVFTDILGANLGRFVSIQLQPIQLETEKPFFMMKRGIENWLYARRKEKHR